MVLIEACKKQCVRLLLLFFVEPVETGSIYRMAAAYVLGWQLFKLKISKLLNLIYTA